MLGLGFCELRIHEIVSKTSECLAVPLFLFTIQLKRWIKENQKNGTKLR